MQVVVTYEHRATSMSSAVYTARAQKNFKKIGLKLGFSAALQRESTEPDFFLGGVDVEKTLPRGGSLQLAWATSQGEILGSGNLIETNRSEARRHRLSTHPVTAAAVFRIDCAGALSERVGRIS